MDFIDQICLPSFFFSMDIILLSQSQSILVHLENIIQTEFREMKGDVGPMILESITSRNRGNTVSPWNVLSRTQMQSGGQVQDSKLKIELFNKVKGKKESNCKQSITT